METSRPSEQNLSRDLRIAIVADDLTGALDTAVAFVRAGRKARVFVGHTQVSSCEEGQGVIVIDTESRHLAPDEARERVRLAFCEARRHGADYFYKKIDSTLRGNVGAELEGMLDTGIGSEIMLTPALPAHGRAVRHGTLYVEGVPVASTHFGRDPLNPVADSDIRRIVGAQSSMPVSICRTPKDMPPREAFGQGRRLIVFDAETESDLRELAERLVQDGRARLCAGSAGLAAALARMLTPPSGRFLPPTVERSTLPALIVCGSLHPASRKATARAALRGYPRLVLPTSVLLDDEPRASNAVAGIAERAVRLLKSDHPPHGFLLVETEPAPASGALDRSLCLAIADRLACVVDRVVSSAKIATVIAFGGDTSAAIARALATTPIVPEGELLPGVVVSRMARQEGVLSLVTKAGGYDHDGLIEELESWAKRTDHPI